ncbi:MAG TPA: thermonuclease family protein [Xylella fastidiosa subsp. pauca]
MRVRFAQINAPEKRQALGRCSKQGLTDFVFSKPVTVIENRRNRYGRVLGTVYVSG